MSQEVQLTAGTLPPPACYATEQERFEAYVAAITATITGGIQWTVGENAPGTLTDYWLKTDANIGPDGIGRPIGGYKYSTFDGLWLPWFREAVYGADAGVADAYAMTPSPALTAVTAYRAGMTYTFLANAANTGASTFQVSGIAGPKAIKKNVTDALAAGDIKAGQAVTLTYDGTNFQMISKTSESTVHGVVTYTSGSGNWTVPTGVFSVEVECVGGGGGGDWAAGARGGGGGGWCYKRWSVTPAALIPYVVGAAGNKTTSFGGAQNTAGGDTSFNTSQIANGGAKGSAGGAGGLYTAADGYGFNGSPGTRQSGGDKYIGGQAPFAASVGGWIASGLATPTDGILGGGGCADLDSTGNESSAGGSGFIVIKW